MISRCKKKRIVCVGGNILHYRIFYSKHYPLRWFRTSQKRVPTRKSEFSSAGKKKKKPPNPIAKTPNAIAKRPKENLIFSFRETASSLFPHSRFPGQRFPPRYDFLLGISSNSRVYCHSQLRFFGATLPARVCLSVSKVKVFDARGSRNEGEGVLSKKEWVRKSDCKDTYDKFVYWWTFGFLDFQPSFFFLVYNVPPHLVSLWDFSIGILISTEEYFSSTS